LPWLISQVRVKTYVKNCLVLVFLCSSLVKKKKIKTIFELESF